jgi:hypothetical protein
VGNRRRGREERTTRERKVRATREVVRVRRVENCILMMVCWSDFCSWSGEMVVC